MLGKIFSLIALACLGSCASLSGYRYEPSAAEVTFSDAGEAPWMRCYVHLDGLRSVDSGSEARVRFLVENDGAETLQIVPGEFSLLDGALRKFGEAVAHVEDNGGWSVAPDDSKLVEIAFPFPPGDAVNLDTLTFAWGVRAGVEVVPASTTFERVRTRAGSTRFGPAYRDPFYRSSFYDPWCHPLYGPWRGY